MKNDASNPSGSPMAPRAADAGEAVGSTSWQSQSTKLGLARLRAELSKVPEIAAYAGQSRHDRRCWPDLLFAAVTLLGGIALVVHGAGRNLLPMAAGSILLVLCLSCVSSLNHDAWHRHLSRSERFNDLVASWFLSPLLVADFEVQQRNHFRHHAYLGEAADPDGQLYRMSTGAFVRMLLARALVVPYLLKIAGLRQEASANRVDERLLRASSLVRIALVHGAWFGAVVLGAWLVHQTVLAVATAVLFGYLLPLLLGSFMIAIRGHREHFVDGVSGKTVSFDTDCFFFERWLIAGGEFNWHACHHLFPEVPQRRLPGLGKLIARSAEAARFYDAAGSPIAAKSSYFTAVPDRLAVTAVAADRH